jgi:hypothetical protein
MDFALGIRLFLSRSLSLNILKHLRNMRYKVYKHVVCGRYEFLCHQLFSKNIYQLRIRITKHLQ